MYVSQKIRLEISDSDAQILDLQSKLVVKHYNKLLEFSMSRLNKSKTLCSVTYSELKDMASKIANDNIELKNLNYSFVIGSAYTLNEAIKKFNRKLSSFPKFKSSQLRWMSLFFTHREGKFQDVIINNKDITIKIGRQNPYFLNLKLKTKLIHCNKLINYRILKEGGKYYIAISMDKDFEKLPKTGESIAIDFNHSNFFMAINSRGETFEMKNLSMIKYFNKQTDCLNKKLSKKKIETLTNSYGFPYKVYSKNYLKINQCLNKLNHKKKVQITAALYTIANLLVEKYDIICVGDYVPNPDDAINTTMRRAMVNNSVIAKFKTILGHVCNKTGKVLRVVNEYGTTMTCHSCGYIEKKEPNVRIFQCPKCNKIYQRDINSAINIGIYGGIFQPNQFNNIDLKFSQYILNYNIYKCSIEKKKNVLAK